MHRAGVLHRSGSLLLLLLPLDRAPLLADDGLDDPGGYTSHAFDENSAGTDLAYACAAQADGKILIAGEATSDAEGGYKIAVTRVLLDGNPDPAFGGGAGEVVISLTGEVSGNQGRARAIAVDAQGRILIGGTLNETDFFDEAIGFVVRLLPNGTIDDNWYNGYSLGWYLDNLMSGVAAMGFDSAGRLWTTGPEAADGSGPWRFQVISDSGGDLGDGAIDFDADVTALASSAPTTIEFQPDGKVLVGGFVQRGAPTHLASMAIARVKGSDFQLDTTFGFLANGRKVIDDFASSRLRSIGLTPDLQIVVAGEEGALNAEDVSVIGMDPDGTVRWGDYVAFDLGGSEGDGIGGLSRMVVQSDGKIVVAAVSYTGNSGNVVDVGVARWLPMMAGLDTSFGGGGTGKRVLDMPPVGTGNGNDTLTCLTLSGGKAVLVGSALYSGTDWDFSLRRLTSDLVFADSFESGTKSLWSAAVP
jgi:uncharacterized delta-60 repeat protein